MDLANLKLDCLGDRPDVRDFSLIEALEKLNRERNQEFKYVLFDLENYIPLLASLNDSNEIVEEGDIDESREEEILDGDNSELQEKLFRKFEIIDPFKSREENAENIDFSILPASTYVIIPLRQQRLKIESRKFNGTGGLFIVDEDGNVKGEFRVQGNKIKLFRFGVDEEEVEMTSRLVINASGQVSIEGEAIKTVYLGEGFRSYSISKENFSPIEDQGTGGLCAACAGASILEYFQRKMFSRNLDASKLFLHQAACKLTQDDPNKGASVKSVVAAMTVFGVPPEEYWPYNLDNLNVEPPADCYAYARNNRSVSYFRLDRFGMTKETLIAQIKVMVYADFPVICGFSVYESIQQSLDKNSNGHIPYPMPHESYQGGHAVVIIGYDDNQEIYNLGDCTDYVEKNVPKIESLKNKWLSGLSSNGKNKFGKNVWPRTHFTSRDSFLSSYAYIKDDNDSDSKKIFCTKGAFKIRNSWGAAWGEGGYGWLPYAYVYQGLATGFWTILKFNLEELGISAKNNQITVCNPKKCQR